MEFNLINHSTPEANIKEIERIYAGFKERISVFSKYTALEFPCTLVVNPDISEYDQLIRLKESLLCIVSEEVKDKLSQTQYSDLLQKLRFFAFEKKGINNLLFILGEIKNQHNLRNMLYKTVSNDALYQPMETIDAIKAFVAVEKSHKQRAMVCIFGDPYSGKTTCALSIAKGLEQNVKIVTNSELFSLKPNSISKIFEESNDKVVIFENVDFLFSDQKGNQPTSIDLTKIRDQIIFNWEQNNTTIIFTLKSSDYIPKSFSNRFSLILGLDNPSLTTRERIASELLTDKEVIQFVTNELSGISLGQYINIVNEIYLLEGKSSFNLQACKNHVAFLTASHAALKKVTDADYNVEHPNISLDRVILPDSSKEQLKMALSAVIHRDYLINTIGWNEIDPNLRSIINFYGPPGTGKTMTARAIATFMTQQTGLPYELMSLNYSEIESKYVGDAPKKLEKAFNYAKGKNVIMFFDEADSFLGKRISNVEHGSDQAINSLRSTMLIQLEQYTGVVIFATNLTCNYDKAFKTRFLAEIEFKLPTKETLAKIFKSNLPSRLLNNPSLWTKIINDEDFSLLGEIAVGLSGRDVKNINQRVILKNIHRQFSVEDFVAEINTYKAEQKSEREFSKQKQAAEPQPLPEDVEKALKDAKTVVNEDCDKVRDKIKDQLLK